MRTVDRFVIALMSQRRRLAVPLIVIFVADQLGLSIYFGIHYGVVAGLIVFWISGIGWLGALSWIAIRYGDLIRLAFATRPLSRR